MKSRKDVVIVLLSALAAGLLAASITCALLTRYYARAQFETLSGVISEIVQKNPASQTDVLDALKDYTHKAAQDDDFLRLYGYSEGHIAQSARRAGTIAAGTGFATSAGLFFACFLYWRKRSVQRAREIVGYLERVNSTGRGALWPAPEDDFSTLRDEIYKTVTALDQARDEAVRARNNYADNLSNIAHQLKTPITAISLCAQSLGESRPDERLSRIKTEIDRLSRLESALLLMSRVDSGALGLNKDRTDVFTLLSLASDSLTELVQASDVAISIPEMGQLDIFVDMEWTMEAFINIFKNCVEHTPSGGKVNCLYEGNPLYARVQIWDEGKGFAAEDIPRLFDRFYRGRDEACGGIGIGLSLAKAIIEAQDGVITAENHPGGGAAFEIRFYGH